MNRINKFVWALGGAFWCAIQCFAIETTDSIRNYHNFDFIEQTNVWTTLHNPSGISLLQTDMISKGEIAAKSIKGGLVDYHQSPQALDISGDVASYYRFNKKVVGYGNISYDNYTGKEMAGSAWIDPNRKPFDITEFNTENIGTKHRDTYRLVGALGIRLMKQLAIGAKMDYTTANYAKYKDLRHKNSYLNLGLAMGLLWSVGKAAKLGIHYEHNRNIESLKFSMNGKTDKTYISLINYGVFIGDLEQFSNTGLTDRNNEFPLVDLSHGIGIQTEFNVSTFSFLNQFRYNQRHGYYGKDAPGAILFTKHRSKQYAYNGIAMWKQSRNIHKLSVDIEIENLVNDKQTYRTITLPTGASKYEYYHPVKMANKVWSIGRVGYIGYYNIKRELPQTTLRVGMRWGKQKQTAYYYPYLRRQNISQTEWYINGSRNIKIAKNLLTLALGGSYKHGSGLPYEDATMAIPSEKQKDINAMNTYLYRAYDYFTAPRWGAEAELKYTFKLPHTNIQTFVSMQTKHYAAQKVSTYSLGRKQTILGITMGCLF